MHVWLLNVIKMTALQSGDMEICIVSVVTKTIKVSPLGLAYIYFVGIVNVPLCSRPQELLTRHKIMCAEFLEKNYDEVFKNYEGLLNSTNYVTRRQSLKVS